MTTIAVMVERVTTMMAMTDDGDDGDGDNGGQLLITMMLLTLSPLR